MFKLFIMVLAISNTGSVSQNVTVTDYDDPVACKQIAAQINGQTEVSYGSTNAKVISRAICDTRQKVVVGSGLPPPEAFLRFFNGVINAPRY